VTRIVSQLEEDGALLEAWRRGDKAAGEELFRRHFDAVHRYFLKNLRASGRGADAEDLTQRSFEACVTGRDRVQGDFRGYLFGVARRQLFVELKQRSTRGDTVTPSDAGIRDANTSPSGRVARIDQQKIFLVALEGLPSEFRAVIERFYWQEQPITVIAEALGIAPGTVKSRLFRGKALLRERLEQLRAPPEVRDSATRAFEEKLRALEPK
jgi:RNA polymerase sigma factor (sigma-70 family)